MSRSLEPVQPPRRGRIIGCSDADIAEAAEFLRAGDLVVMPTETVYGLAADATQGEAVARIYEAKGRPAFNPLISHVASIEQALEHGVLNEDARRLAAAFWPGPLTLVAPLRPGSPISDIARAGLPTVALRVPSHPVALALIRAAGAPIAAPSANLSGRISATSAEDAAAELGGSVAMVLDAGRCGLGLESTIVACLDGRVFQLRPGGVPRESLAEVLGRPVGLGPPQVAPLAPGMLRSHYAPFAKMRIDATRFSDDEAILAFGEVSLPEFPVSRPVVNLSPEGNLRQAAANLFSAMRVLDAFKPAAIAVTPIPRTGLGEAINDRLARAAAPRDDH